MLLVTSLNAQTLHEIYVLIYLTTSKKTHTLVLSGLNSVLISLLDLDTRQNINNLKEVVLVHYKEGVSVTLSKNQFYDKEISLCC